MVDIPEDYYRNLTITALKNNPGLGLDQNLHGQIEDRRNDDPSIYKDYVGYYMDSFPLPKDLTDPYVRAAYRTRRSNIGNQTPWNTPYDINYYAHENSTNTLNDISDNLAPILNYLKPYTQTKMQTDLGINDIPDMSMYGSIAKR